MSTDYTHLFRKYLVSMGYDESILEDVHIQSRQLDFNGVAVKDKNEKDGKTIQAFALMSDKVRCSHHVYPFYRTMRWKNNGTIMPSCSVASMDKEGNWTIYDARNTYKQRSEDYIDYHNALSRFRKRIDAAPARALYKRVYITSWLLALLLLLYLSARVVWPCLGIPLDGEMVTMFILISVLSLLPTLLPLIKSISFFGIDLIIGKD